LLPQLISRNEAINYDQPNEEIKAGSVEKIKCTENEQTVLVNNSKDTLPAVQRIIIEKEAEIIEKILRKIDNIPSLSNMSLVNKERRKRNL